MIVPGSELQIPHDWWMEAGMVGFSPNSDHYATNEALCTAVVAFNEVEPPMRQNGQLWFRNKESVVAVLRSMRVGEALDPVEVWSKQKTDSQKYSVRDGFHRFYLSLAVGYKKLPVRENDFDMYEYFEKERAQKI